MADKLIWSGRYGGLSVSVRMIGDSPRAFIGDQMAFGEDELGILRRAVVVASEQATYRIAVFSHNVCRGVFKATSAATATAFIYGISVGENCQVDGEGIDVVRDYVQTYLLDDPAQCARMRAEQENIDETDSEVSHALSAKGWTIKPIADDDRAPTRSKDE